MTTGRSFRVRGIVQGVGFRPWVFRIARENGIFGEVRNDEAGVTIEAFGSAQALERFTEQLAQPPPAAEIAALEWRPLTAEGPSEFRIAPSAPSPQRQLTIPPDIATCETCLSEVDDPANRRYRYPFTNCTNCGPRFSIVLDVPYDRAATTLEPFTMCSRCAQEYRTPADRRFHAEPNACPVCGPRPTLLDAGGTPLSSSAPIASAAALLRRGSILAIKGLGGFHLACDATCDATVGELRRRKRRNVKPFAIMVRDLDEAERLVHLHDDERLLLTSPARPILLARGRTGSTLSLHVAPGNPLVGIMLPYTPLHHLLLQAYGGPLVMTSGNLSEEPIAYRNDEALERLRGIADAFLVHDREIATRTDDSVIRFAGGKGTFLRRSRGYVPRSIPLRRTVPHSILACGAHLKNTFCHATGDEAYLGPHIGDLDNVETYAAYERAIELMERLLAIRPAAVAHDLHPEYLSTRYARERSGVALVGVQHHHAHVASVMAEHGLDGPVLGVAYDGTGYGTDGTAWGGEILLATYAGFERIATFRPLALAGGNAAIRQVWRVALAVLVDAFDGLPPPAAMALLQGVPKVALETVRRMIEKSVNAPLARGVGRYFDAFGALLLGISQARYEGEVAMMLEHAQDAACRHPLAYAIDFESNPWLIDLRPAVREAVVRLGSGDSPGALASRFHTTLIDATAAVLRAAAEARGRLPVALTGGCFANDRLAGGIVAALSRTFEVYRNERVPPGDGGIALGQAAVAAALLREGGG